MAKIEDLIAQISDERLRTGIAAEVKALKRTKKFGLVFEEHLPETIRLPKLPIKPGERVALKSESGNDLWTVKYVHNDVATCSLINGNSSPTTTQDFSVANLVAVRNFGEAIYPALVPVDHIERGGPTKPWHALIEADNFHALQLLLYCYEGMVDVIYIDPPYNTGARDWKYNNDYVDSADMWRHSKWLAMMKRRLVLAKRLLRPDDGVLVVTIDEHEVHHLGMLLEELFPTHYRQMVTIVNNPKGVAQGRFSRVEEYALFCFGPKAKVVPGPDDLLSEEIEDEGSGVVPRWYALLRSGTDAQREDNPSLFYPVFIDRKCGAIVDVGEPLPEGVDPPKNQNRNGKIVVWPRRKDGSWGRWMIKPQNLRALVAQGYVSAGEFDERRGSCSIYYLGKKHLAQLVAGKLIKTGHDQARNVVEVRYADLENSTPRTVWHRTSHDAGAYGSDLIGNILGKKRAFSFPKSLYAVRDTLGAIVRNRPDALVVDFFAGSGTTFHSIVSLNVEDKGTRRCVLVTNNEVEEDQVKAFARRGVGPGDLAFECEGICHSITWPRLRYSIAGKRDDGSIIEGAYLSGRLMSEGFKENAEYFRLDFLDPATVARGDAFEAVLPILWMMAGCRGKREDSKGSQAWFIPKQAPFAVLIKEKEFRAFRDALDDRPDLEWIFLVTDSDENFAHMRQSLGRKYQCVQLYKSYLENFRLNIPSAAQNGGVA